MHIDVTYDTKMRYLPETIRLAMGAPAEPRHAGGRTHSPNGASLRHSLRPREWLKTALSLTECCFSASRCGCS
jgi:hypothetical protein